MTRLLSLSVGLPRGVTWNGSTVRTHLHDWPGWRIDYVQTRPARKKKRHLGTCWCAARSRTRISVLTFGRTRLYFVQQLGGGIDRARTSNGNRQRALPLAGVPVRGCRGRVVSIPYMRFCKFITVSCFSSPTPHW